MGCVSSKKALIGANSSPLQRRVAYKHSRSRNRSNASSRRSAITAGLLAVDVASSKSNSGVLVVEAQPKDPKPDEPTRDPEECGKGRLREGGSLSRRIGLSYRFVEAEQNAAGWPAWLTSFAGEAIQGWVPLRTDSFEKLDQIGSGTYSSVFQAREVETGKMVALKKVRFDKFQPESIRFMAREIIILRTLDHPNIMKLEGIITSQLSNSIYLVFEYMEHDLAGLVSSPDIKFSESQIKCYTRQLLSGLEHCHLQGIMHRDIKVSNILLNNEGNLKIADFGLANTLPNDKQPLTSRVVTLWYRPPELLMGSTNYGVSVDLWSVGCVFAELFLGKPILKGRNEVEQLHNIFKLCGSPPDEFWRKCKLPLATVFKPHTNYESSLQERCKGFPVTAVNLVETLLSIDPYKRGTASSALLSEYFGTKPYACSPSDLPRYPPSKELDAKIREDIRRKKNGGKPREAIASSRKQRRVYKVSQDPNHFSKLARKEEMQSISQNDCKAHQPKGKLGVMHKEPSKPSLNSNGYSAFSGPAPVTGSSGFTWAKRRKPDASSALSEGSRSKISGLDPTFAKGTYDLTKHRLEFLVRKRSYNAGCQDETSKHLQNRHAHDVHRGSLDAADTYHSSYYIDFDPTEKMDATINAQGHRKHVEPVEQPLPTMIQTNKNDEFLHWDENNRQRSVRKSRFGRDK